MLRVERHPHSREISLKMRKSPTDFGSRDLWIGLAIALTLHLAAILLFRFPIVNLKSLSNPAQVVVETITPMNQLPGIRADWTPHPSLRLLPEELLAPRSAQPPLPGWKPLPISEDTLAHKPNQLPSFAAIEQLVAIARPTPLRYPSTAFTMNIRVSGPLAEIPFNLIAPLMVEPQPRQHYSFEVRVDNQTGRICCFNPTETEEDLEHSVNVLGEKILAQMHFKTRNRPSLTPGLVEITFNGGQEDSP